MICINETYLSQKMSVEHKHKEYVAVESTEEVDNVQLSKTDVLHKVSIQRTVLTCRRKYSYYIMCDI